MSEASVLPWKQVMDCTGCLSEGQVCPVETRSLAPRGPVCPALPSHRHPPRRSEPSPAAPGLKDPQAVEYNPFPRRSRKRSVCITDGRPAGKSLSSLRRLSQYYWVPLPRFRAQVRKFTSGLAGTVGPLETQPRGPCRVAPRRPCPERRRRVADPGVTRLLGRCHADLPVSQRRPLSQHCRRPF